MARPGFISTLFCIGLSVGVLGITSCDKSPPAPDGGAPAVCRRDCAPGCPAASMCVVPTALHEYAAFCGQPCNTDADCSGKRCASLFNMPGTAAVCVANDVPERCPGVPEDPNWHCDFTAPTCKSANVLMKGFSQPSNRVCGYEYIYCKSGCVDGGVAGGGAHCQ